jgi:hypothetical protein
MDRDGRAKTGYDVERSWMIVELIRLTDSVGRAEQTLTDKKEGFAIWTIAKPFKQRKRLP